MKVVDNVFYEKEYCGNVVDEEHQIKRIRFQYYSGTLWMVLPSGRRLAYLQPKLQPNRFGRMSLTFCGTGANNKWQRQETYSGKIVENATQAIARDILTEAMWRLEKAGFEIVGHVHATSGYTAVTNKATTSAGGHAHTISGATASAGSGSAHSNLQPYIVCYMWKRTA